jgi:hypothetical protein
VLLVSYIAAVCSSARRAYKRHTVAPPQSVQLLRDTNFDTHLVSSSIKPRLDRRLQERVKWPASGEIGPHLPHTSMELSRTSHLGILQKRGCKILNSKGCRLRRASLVHFSKALLRRLKSVASSCDLEPEADLDLVSHAREDAYQVGREYRSLVLFLERTFHKPLEGYTQPCLTDSSNSKLFLRHKVNAITTYDRKQYIIRGDDNRGAYC